MTPLDDLTTLATSLGWRLFPTNGDKTPAVPHWPTDATRDFDAISRWWAEGRRHWAVALDASIAVVDIDVKSRDHDGWSTLRGMDVDLPATLAATTPSGGTHMFYATSEPLRNRVPMVPGVDLKTAGGYVLVPPSPGRAWTGQISPGSIADAPEWLFVHASRVDTIQGPTGEATADDWEGDREDLVLRAYLWLRKAEPAIEGHGGDARTYAVCAALVRDFALTVEEAVGVMQVGIDDDVSWNDRCRPPWSESDLRRKIINARKYARGVAGQKRDARPGERRRISVAEQEGSSGPAVREEALREVSRRLGIAVADTTFGWVLGHDPCVIMRVSFHGIDYNLVITCSEVIDPKKVASSISAITRTPPRDLGSRKEWRDVAAVIVECANSK